jgi:DNA-binding IclR family transcriptional regulator
MPRVRTEPQARESRTAGRVVDTLDLLLSSREGLTLTDVSAELRIPKSTVHGILQAMRRRGYVALDERTKTYSLGLRLIARAHDTPVVQVVQADARPLLERLAHDIEETVLLCGYESDAVVCIDQIESPSAVRYTVRIGDRWPLERTSAGKIYLSQLDDAELNGDAKLRREIDAIRETGYAMSRAELTAGVMCVSAPVLAHDGSADAAVCVIGSAERVEPKERAVVDSLLRTTKRLSKIVGSAGAPRRA